MIGTLFVYRVYEYLTCTKNIRFTYYENNEIYSWDTLCVILFMIYSIIIVYRRTICYSIIEMTSY